MCTHEYMHARACTPKYMHARACAPPPTLAAVYLQLGPSLFVSTGCIYSGSTTSCPQLPGTQVTVSDKLSALDLWSLGLFPTARPQKWIPCLGWPRGTNSVPYVRILIPHSHARVLSISAAVVSPVKKIFKALYFQQTGPLHTRQLGSFLHL